MSFIPAHWSLQLLPSTNQKVALYGKLSNMHKTYGWNRQPQGLGENPG
jgi:hypothetical protein